MPGSTSGIRMYLGNLPPDVNEKDIREFLKTYGRAGDVDIKHRKDHEGRVTSTFAHCTLNVDQVTVQKCLAEINQQKWKGYTTKAEVAKESYLQRMQAKRESQNKDSNSSYVHDNYRQGNTIENSNKNWGEKSNNNCESLKKKCSTGSEEILNTGNAAKKSKLTNAEDSWKKKKSPDKNSKKREYKEDSSDSEIEVFWEKNFHSKAVVEMDTERVKSQPGSLLSKLESFSSVWGDTATSQDSTPFRIKDPSPRKSKQFEQANSFDTHPNTEQVDNKVGGTKKEKRGEKSKKGADIEEKGTRVEFNKKEKVCKMSLNANNEQPKKWDPSKSKKQQVSEQQRLKSLAERVDQRDQQQALVRQALAGQPANKKIKFDEESHGMIQEEPTRKVEKPGRLFEDSDESDSEPDFNIRNQFEGKSGEKLLELQSRFATDSRFRLDSRFAESESEEEQLDNEQEEQPGDVQEEHIKQLSILDSILGPNNKVTVKPAKKQDNRLAAIVRFDPSKPEHTQKYKVDAETKSTKKSKKSREEEEEQTSRSNETEMPEVSSERFYEVSSGLQHTLQPKSDFSLRALFGHDGHEQDQEDVDEEQSIEQIMPQPVAKALQPGRSVKVAATWSESFFFKPQDHRLQEGVDFFTNRGEESKAQFEQRRRELWTAVKSKLRNVTKKKVTFERKLGGKPTKHRRFKSKRSAKPRK